MTALASQEIQQRLDDLADKFVEERDKRKRRLSSTLAFIVSEERFSKAQAMLNRLHRHGKGVQTLCRNKFAIIVCACAIPAVLPPPITFIRSADTFQVIHNYAGIVTGYEFNFTYPVRDDNARAP